MVDEVDGKVDKERKAKKNSITVASSKKVLSAEMKMPL
jgi:hypothetical protein